MLAKGATKTLYKVSDFLNWQRSGLLILAPKFQRRSVWPSGAKSYLMDTIIRNMPIPVVILREQKASLRTLQHKREVVDGQQRLRTVISFVAPSLLGEQFDPARDTFVIKGVHNREFGGMSFRDLPPDIRRGILDYEFSIDVLPSSITDREVIEIFARMNATGYKLNEQEVRNANYFGDMRTTVLNLAAEQLQRWIDWRIFKWEQIARMSEVELTSEFVLLFMKGITGKSQSSLNTLYKDYESSFPERKEVERRFRLTMELISDELGGEAISALFRKRPLFYSLFASFYDKGYGIGSKLRRGKPLPLPKGFSTKVMAAGERIKRKTAPERVLNSLSRRTTHPSSRRTVISYLCKS